MDNKQVWTVVVTAVMLGGFFLFLYWTSTVPPTAVSTEGSIPSTIDVQAQHAASETANEKTAADPSAECEVASKQQFDIWVANGISSPSDQSYQSHFSVTSGTCYMLWKYTNGDWLLSYNLWDVYQRNPKTGKAPNLIGGFLENVQQSRIDQCNVGGQECTSVEEFLSLTVPYLKN